MSYYYFGAEIAFPSASKFETFVLLQLVYELELLELSISISVFWLGNPHHLTNRPKNRICTKNDPYVHHLSSEFQISISIRFEVIAISGSDYRIWIFVGKKERDFRRKALRKSQYITRQKKC